MGQVRLHKYIADCGLTSRRKAEELILQGRVVVNGKKVTRLGVKVDGGVDAVLVDGRPVDSVGVKRVYVLLNKPRGFVTTASDPEGRKTVMDLVQDVGERIYPVGRLDYLSEGLLLLTNDGEVAQEVSHPSHGIEKVYEVKIFGEVTGAHLERLREGAFIQGKRVVPKSARVIKRLKGKTWLEFRIGEGRNREVRKICERVGLTVDKLKRVSIGALSIAGIAPGKYIFLTRAQLLKALRSREGYLSSKKSLRPKRSATGRSADDKNFQRFRREKYFATMEELASRQLS